MATIFNTIEKVAGQPQPNIVVTVTLLWDTSVSPVAMNSSEETMIQGPYVTRTDEVGHWEIAVDSNDLITPVDSVYKVSEAVSDGPYEYYITVPDGATPTFWVGDVMTTTPGWL